MKTLYLECNMGAAGDMLMAALLELHPAPEDFLARLNRLGLPGVAVSAARSVKCGVTGTHISVRIDGEEERAPSAHEEEHAHARIHEHEHNHDHDHCHDHDHEHEHPHEHNHAHAGMEDIQKIVAALNVSDSVKASVLSVYGIIAEAESEVHGVPVGLIHFHEVGSLDALADITGVSMLMEELAPDRVLASPVRTGSGQVRCAHGVLPVPAPATARILRNVPIYGGTIRGELCTPTGAALLKHFVSDFCNMPVMRVSRIGYGMGSRDFPAANCLRAMMGETDEGAEQISELRCGIDDMTPEALGFAQEELFAGGALDVYTISAGMKKNRPGVLLCCVCREDNRDSLLRLLFKHTTTLGVRECVCNRYRLSREEGIVETEFGPVRVKKSKGWGTERWKAEYEDLARTARENGLSLKEAEEAVRSAKRSPLIH